MNRFICQQQQQKGLGFVAAAAAEMRRGDAVTTMVSNSPSDCVVCPKPRRVGVANCPPRDSCRPSPFLHINNQQVEACDANARNELLDMILTKGAKPGDEKPIFPVASSPPFFSGSPPSRASNPVIQDKQFGISELSPMPPMLEPLTPPASRKSGGGCARVKYGHSPAPVRRIEGFNCHNHRGISAVA